MGNAPVSHLVTLSFDDGFRKSFGETARIYEEFGLKAWDIAAGVLLVREAGGVVTDLDGRDIELFRPRFCASATSALQQELLKTLNDASGVA